jgi:flagellar biosynthetic protein FlhB
MSGSDAQDKTQSATPKRREDARKRGQVPRSRELSMAAIMATAAGLMMGLGGSFARKSLDLMRQGLSFDASQLTHPQDMPMVLGHFAAAAMWLVMPILLGLLAVTLTAPLLIGGWNFSTDALVPDFKRLNPAAGLGRMFSVNGLIEVFKGLAKFILLGAIAGSAWWSSRADMVALGSEPVAMGIGHGMAMCLHSFALLCGALVLIAAIDVPWQIYQYEKKLKMSKQELKDEYKQSEGRPEVKARIRQVQRAMAQRRMMTKVPTADVIIVNPTHYAVALVYKPGTSRAPRVVAKGADLVAQSIRELAAKHRIAIVEAPPLARAIYRHTELDDEIPVTLYAAVAQVLTYVYQLKAYRGGPRPAIPQVGDVPGGELDVVE